MLACFGAFFFGPNVDSNCGIEIQVVQTEKVRDVNSKSVRTTEDRQHRNDHFAERVRLQYTCYAVHQIVARGEEFAWPGIASDP